MNNNIEEGPPLLHLEYDMKYRNYIAAGEYAKRRTAGPMKDRRAPRGGTKNAFALHMAELEDNSPVDLFPKFKEPELVICDFCHSEVDFVLNLGLDAAGHMILAARATHRACSRCFCESVLASWGEPG